MSQYDKNREQALENYHLVRRRFQIETDAILYYLESMGRLFEEPWEEIERVQVMLRCLDTLNGGIERAHRQLEATLSDIYNQTEVSDD